MNRHYLTKVTPADARAHKRFKCKAAVRLVYKKTVKQPISSCRAVILEVSQGGALIGTSADVPEHFYIVIGNFEYSIGCAVKRREGSVLAVEFIKEQPGRIVEAFALLRFPMAPLFSLKGLLRNELMQPDGGAPPPISPS
ncbi:hypothetical protein [Pararhizobium sp.]|uniref:hypothetical protein n=1 Tax=Pararhizobium sp. TaxID=1977563 RepID=UPI00271A7291|nr:hypothetical protein [Pararhizobium sp.]MDO9417248.1 hypothetical protein [Pararhizobium sp.]